MAEASDNTQESLQSVEVDAAPSVDYVKLDNLDIGSECEIKSEPKLRECIKEEENDVVTTHVNYEKTFKAVAVSTELKNEGNLETGLVGLNLEEKEEPEVNAEENVCADELMQRDSDGDTLLHVAILSLQADIACTIIDLMVEMGITLDIRNNLHQSPLHLAVLTLQPEIVKYLLKCGSSVFQRDHKLRTAMMVACEVSSMEILELLLNYCEPLVTENETSSTLLNPNINPLDLPNADGERCLHIAARDNNTAIMNKLIDNGADPNLPDRKSGRTALHEAADLGHVEMVRCLISKDKVDINEVTYNDETALEIAHMRERTEVIALLRHKSLPITKRKTKTDTSTG